MGRTRQMEDVRAYKVILGSRLQLEDNVNTYELQFLPAAGYKTKECLDIRRILRDMSIKQLKALSRKHLMMEETDYPVMEEHKSLFHSIFNPKAMDVVRALKQVDCVVRKLSFASALK